MTPDEQSAIASICLLAAFTDGSKTSPESERIKCICDDFADAEAALPQLYQRVLLRQTSVAQEAARLTSPQLRQLAWEMAVCVCDADDVTSPAEQAFLEDLRQRLGLAADSALTVVRRAEALSSSAPSDEPVALLAAVPAATSAAPTAAPPPPPPPSRGAANVDAKAIDDTIHRYAMLAAAMELLPQTLGTMAIIPLQVKLVHAIGKAYGYALDSGHIKEFIGAVGVGMTSQVVEKYARKIIGGILGGTLGGIIGGTGRVATGAAMTWASTWALGQVARSYYASGRTLSMDALRPAFSEQLGKGRSMYQQQAPQIEAHARTLNPAAVLGELGARS